MTQAIQSLDLGTFMAMPQSKGAGPTSGDTPVHFPKVVPLKNTNRPA